MREGIMSVKNDAWIIKQAAKGMIEPFVQTQERSGVISYGVSSYGYDMRVANEWKHVVQPADYPPNQPVTVDPKDGHIERHTELLISDVYVIPPGGLVLCRSYEYFRIPRSVLGIVLGKSTYARCGLLVNCTPLEPEWEGHITIELSNVSRHAIRVYANEGIAQVYFLGGKDCRTSYADKKGKYQHQRGVVLPKVE